MIIDTTFDFTTDAGGKDPDSHSKTLKQYHKILWSKKLPSGECFELQENEAKKYLVFMGIDGVQYLSSDAIANTFRHHRGKMASVIVGVEQSLVEEFYSLNSTMGAYILFPGNKVESKLTINVQRGLNHYIADRFDLTLECIRLHYIHEPNLLSDVLNRYDSFFRLFKDFQNYVDFFLLNDLVSTDYSEVLFFRPINKLLDSSPLPKDAPTYLAYREDSMNFVRRRNKRIADWAAAHIK